VPIESGEIKLACLSSIIDRCQSNQVIQNSHLTPWFWLMPDRSYNHSSFQLNFYWKLRMDCFAMQSFSPKEGMSWNSFSSGPELRIVHMAHRVTHSLSFMGPWTFSLCSEFPCEFKEKLFENLENTSNYPCQNKPPVPEIPPDLSTSKKKPRGV